MHEEVLRLLDGLHAVRLQPGACCRASQHGCEVECITGAGCTCILLKHYVTAKSPANGMH